MRHPKVLPSTISIIVILMHGCGQPQQSKPAQAQVQSAIRLEKPPEVTSGSNDGWHDLVFFIQEYKTLADGTQILLATGVYRGRKLSVRVALGPSWQSGSLGKDVAFVTYFGNIQFRSNGTESDTFLQVIDEIYGTKQSPKKMRGETNFTAITLEGDPRRLDEGPVKIKLFYESDMESEYAEVYTNIDLAAKKLEVLEKDEDYRVQLVRDLQAP